MSHTEDSRLIEAMISREKIFPGYIFDVERWQVRLPNGKTAPRELVLHKGASAIVALDGAGSVAMIRQYRAALGRVIWEIPAGKLDTAQEDPLECARRELREETGLSAEHFEKLTAVESAPGYSSEIIHIYLATGIRRGEAAPDADEFVDFTWQPLDAMVRLVMEGTIGDSKTIAGLLLAKARQRG